jgi:cytidylate kinase
VHADLARRDALDSNRSISPLQVAPDALVVDTTGRKVDDVVAEIVGRFEAEGRSR